MDPLPVSGRLAWWGTAWLRGAVSPDDVLDAVLDDDVTHVVVGTGAGLMSALAEIRRAGGSEVGAAFPTEGDLCGLGGPHDLNTAALDAGEAALASSVGVGLVPVRVGPTVEWAVHEARRRQIPDVGEADRALRGALLAGAEQLAALEVARWRPEVADRLMNLRHRSALASPPGVPQRCVELAARGLQALAITDLAVEDDGGALSVHEVQQRREAIDPLARAARRALVAACSPEVWPPE